LQMRLLKEDAELQHLLKIRAEMLRNGGKNKIE